MDKVEFYSALLLGRVNRNASSAAHPELLISKVDYNSAGDVLYFGLAVQGSATSDSAWRVEKMAYDSSANYTGSTLSQPNQVWDNRATLTYT